MYCHTSSASFDWVALLALFVAIISVGFAVYYNRKTLLLTEAHNKKTVEPLICDLYTSNLIIEENKNSRITYEVKYCGLGPAIIKSFNYNLISKDFTLIFDLYRECIGKPR
jgi:hypothetical protein